MATDAHAGGARRALSLFDVLCLGINAIVGSGIYLFPGKLAALLGPASFLAFATCGLVAALVGLCFAEAAGSFERSGGPYVYARAAFGGVAGYLVGWACWAAALLSYAAVARGVTAYLGQILPALAADAPAAATAVGIVILLGAVNVVGIRPGAITTDLFTIAKLLPLVTLVGAGVVRGRLVPAGPLAPRGLRDLPAAAFGAFFAFQGFEVVPVPAGETENPRRNAPLAVLGSLAGATLLYMAVQWIATASTPELASAKQPLAAVGTVLLGGDLGGGLVAVAAVISMLGFCSGVALAGPRYVEALAEDAILPPAIARRHARFGTPYLAIGLTTLLTAVLVLVLDFARLVDLSVLTVSVQYLATCLAVPLLRVRRPELPRSFRLPAGPLIPLLAVVVTLWLGAQAGLRELLWFAAILALGGLAALGTRVGRACLPRGQVG
jgi:amino acid transporter